jgi:hypothetical protein
MHTGVPVLVASGLYRGIEGTVDHIDASEDAVVVNVELFGRAVPLTFPLSSINEHLTPVGDQPAVLSCPNADIRQRDLLSQCANADSTYRTDCWWSTTVAFVQVSRTGSLHRLIVCAHNLTWPCREKMQWSVREVPLTSLEWTKFTRLIEKCRFWHLPYDDGRRIPRKDKHWHWWLEGYEDGRYHAVVRAASEPTSEISACCDYVRALAEIDGER